MIFGLFKKHCLICGQDVEKENVVKIFGKTLCSEEHAEEYRQKLEKEKSKATSGGGSCCGK